MEAVFSNFTVKPIGRINITKVAIQQTIYVVMTLTW